jgi:hypothetical protein
MKLNVFNGKETLIFHVCIKNPRKLQQIREKCTVENALNI